MAPQVFNLWGLWRTFKNQTTCWDCRHMAEFETCLGYSKTISKRKKTHKLEHSQLSNSWEPPYPRLHKTWLMNEEVWRLYALALTWDVSQVSAYAEMLHRSCWDTHPDFITAPRLPLQVSWGRTLTANFRACFSGISASIMTKIAFF